MPGKSHSKSNGMPEKSSVDKSSSRYRASRGRPGGSGGEREAHGRVAWVLGNPVVDRRLELVEPALEVVQRSGWKRYATTAVVVHRALSGREQPAEIGSSASVSRPRPDGEHGIGRVRQPARALAAGAPSATLLRATISARGLATRRETCDASIRGGSGRRQRARGRPRTERPFASASELEELGLVSCARSRQRVRRVHTRAHSALRPIAQARAPRG